MSPTEIQNNPAVPKGLFTPVDGDVEYPSDSATATPRRRRGPDNGARERSAPVMVEATLHWWRTDERRGAGASNQFGLMPTTAVRFRCIGSLTPRFPKRYRIELAQALDWLPELTQRELKDLRATLAEAVSARLGVEVAPLSCDVLDLELAGENGR